MPALRVVLADDSALFRDGLAALLREADVDVVAQTGEATEIDALVVAHQPSVLVVDVRMPPAQLDEGFQAARRIRLEHPAVSVLVLSQIVDVDRALDLVAGPLGGFGYLLKDRVADVAELRDALERLVGGGFVLDPDVVAALTHQRRHAATFDSLTLREREVLDLMAEGRTNAAIARKLWVTLGAVEKHINNIFRKLELTDTPDDHRRVIAVLRYLAK